MDLDSAHPEQRWADQLDAAMPRSTTFVDPDRTLRTARAAAIRRRRTRGSLALGGVAAAVILSASVSAWPGVPESTPQAGDDRGRDIASAAPHQSARVGASVPETTTNIDVEVSAEVGTPEIDDDGTLVMPRDARLVAAVVEPLDYEAPAHSMAVAYLPAFAGAEERWAMLSIRPEWRTDGGTRVGVEEDGRAGFDQVAEDQGLSFAEWVGSQIDFGVGVHWPEYGLASEPYLTRDGELVVPDDVRVAARLDAPLPLDAPRASVAIAWSRTGAGAGAVAGAEPDSEVWWSLLVSDPTWRPARPGSAGLINGFGSLTRAAEPSGDLASWAAARAGEPFVADPPPAWVAGP